MPSAIKTHKAKSQFKPAMKKLTPNRTLALNSAAWLRLRKLVITEQPLCAHCQRSGRIRPGNEVDHIDDDASNNERSNLVNLCRPCHSVKTQGDRHGHKVKGCDVNGMPLDPNHHWNREKSPERKAPEPTAYPHAHRRT